METQLSLQSLITDVYANAIVITPICYSSVIIAVAIDLISGLRKAHINGEPIHSTGLKRSCRKISDYILPLLALTLVDIIGVIFYSAPLLTMAYAMFCVICEVVSIMERSHQKKQMRRMLNAARQLSNKEIFDALEIILSNSISDNNTSNLNNHENTK